jgi:hypothetical protein
MTSRRVPVLLAYAGEPFGLVKSKGGRDSSSVARSGSPLGAVRDSSMLFDLDVGAITAL